MLNIVLVEPEIPQNTGNIARTCACTHSALHLVKPMAFEITDSQLKRAGLDYWDKLNLTVYDSLDEFLKIHGDKTLWLFTTKAHKSYASVNYGADDFLVFGKETKGLSIDFINSRIDNAVRIPMFNDLRCLNLSNSVAIAAYEALRQHNFFDMDVKI